MVEKKLKRPFKEKQFFLSVTTTIGSDWRAKIDEINELGLKEIALFPTCLEKGDRKELYQLLKKTTVENIPLVHLRNDMELWELDYLVKNYNTQVFNIHSQVQYPLTYDCSKYRDIIYIENAYCPIEEEELKSFGGICLDFAHLENDRLLHKERFEHNVGMIEKYPVGLNHISAIKKYTQPDGIDGVRYDSHYLEDLSELDYLKQYPLNYFSSFVAIELENSIKEQSKAKDYIINLFS